MAQNGAALTPDEAKQEIQKRQGGEVLPNGRDPGFANTDQIDPKGKTRLVYRDIPIITGNQTGTNWTPAAIRSALSAHMYGIFEMSGQLVDAIIADDRVTATQNSRLTGLFGREVRFEPANDSRAAREVLDAWTDQAWPHLTADGSLYQIGAYQNLFGWWPAQVIWADADKMWWLPRLDPWHARYTYFNWDVRKYIALTQDGQTTIFPGDGKWFLHAPRGAYRAWIWGTIRPVAIPWLGRQWALRDMQNFSEVYGAPTRIGWTPAAADPAERDNFQAQLSNLGANTTLLLPRGVDKDMGYGYELVSVGPADWSIFAGVADRCDMHITLAILMQNLTTEVKGGSFAATESHMDIRQGGIEADNQAWKASLRRQVARPFALYNFGDSNLAPWTAWDVTARDEQSERAQRLYSFGQSVQILRQGGVQFKDAAAMKEFVLNELGVKLPDLELTEPDNGAGSGAADGATEADSKTIKGGDK